MRRRPVAAMLSLAAIAALLVGCSAHTTPAVPQARSAAIASAVPTIPVAAAGSAIASVAAAAPVSSTAAATRCAKVPKGRKEVLVSIAKQHLWACHGKTLDFQSAVTTGASAKRKVHDATPTGTFVINGKFRNAVLDGRDVYGSWDDHVKYWIPFQGRVYGFHDASWQKFSYGSQKYKTKGSHGCVHLPLHTIAKLYKWAHIGTVVKITKH